jgi:uncharacterized protein
MKIEIERIKDKEIELNENIRAAEWDLDSFDVKFVDDIHLDCKFTKISKEIFVNARVITNRKITCSRCLQEVLKQVKQNFRFTYSVNELEKYLEVDNALREEILLNFPMKVLCSSNCKGICYGCKANLNIEECRCRNGMAQSAKRIA